MNNATVPAERRRAELAALVQAARNGDRAAWDGLVERLARLVWSVTRAYGLDPHDGDDVAQIAWMRLAENIDRLTDPGSVTTWLATTTKRECITVLRQRARVHPTDIDLFTDELTAPTAEATVFAGERDRLVWEAFGRLSERCRRLLALVVADKRDGYDVISGLLDMPIGSIGPTRQRCLESLREHLAIVGITSLSDASL